MLKRYECDMNVPCLCPYDAQFIQTFETHSDYKMHMRIVHDTNPITRRSNFKSYEPKEIRRRQEQAYHQHSRGRFRNTHVKKDTLLLFLSMYEEFLNDLFNSDEYEGREFKELWNSHFRIREQDLKYQTLDEIVEDLCNGYRSKPTPREISRRDNEWYDEI